MRLIVFSIENFLLYRYAGGIGQPNLAFLVLSYLLVTSFPVPTYNSLLAHLFSLQYDYCIL